MEKATTFEARVVLDSGAYFAYQSLSKTVCIQLSDCAHWQAAKAVEWRNLPAHWYINFFQSDRCIGSVEDVYSASRDRATNGQHTFATPRGIKSIYARPIQGKLSWSVARKCVQLRQPVKHAESTLVYGSKTNSSDIVEDFSSNWFQPIEDGDAIAGK
ncbi:uncharacterized protein IUM83_17094 [Phytophthora cinnamomi]|uniref:uncharacterized protein n=1 Tax=Phytophthora cinnamomi TaxID=4785 RepID=UPI00355943A5|nr:hypothetical protein IUM83_13432 [Phytophthora cinnamomi]KAG6613324.1 hypothetical protein IUM83_17094 [Phytophthora cinnamomi]